MTNTLKISIRKIMHYIAVFIDRTSGHRITPNQITIVGLLAHLPIAVLIANGSLIWASAGLIVFGLMDTLDGELARLQKTTSLRGMLLDSITDRIKEIILLISIAIYLVETGKTVFIAWVVVALGGSLLGSYVQAKGDIAISQISNKQETINKNFRGGLLPFESRMALLVVGLALNQLGPTMVIIAILSFITVAQRFSWVMKALK